MCRRTLFHEVVSDLVWRPGFDNCGQREVPPCACVWLVFHEMELRHTHPCKGKWNVCDTPGAAKHRHICMWKERNASSASPRPTTAHRKCHPVGREGLWSGACGRGVRGFFSQGEDAQAKSPSVPAGTQGHVWAVKWAKWDEAVQAAENQIFTESRLSLCEGGVSEQ